MSPTYATNQQLQQLKEKVEYAGFTLEGFDPILVIIAWKGSFVLVWWGSCYSRRGCKAWNVPTRVLKRV